MVSFIVLAVMKSGSSGHPFLRERLLISDFNTMQMDESTMNKQNKLRALELMKKGHDILRGSKQENLLKSAYFLREAIAKIKTV